MKRAFYVEEGIPRVSYDFNYEQTGEMPVKMVNVFNGRRVEDLLTEFQGYKIRVTIEIIDKHLFHMK